MFSYLKNLFSLLGFSFSFIRKLIFQKKFIKQTLGVDLEKSKETNDGSLDEKDFVKISTIYGYSIPVLLGEPFAILRGTPMTLKERSCLTYLGGLTGLFDDYIDDDQLDESYISDLVSKSDTQSGRNSNERLFLAFINKALGFSEDPEKLRVASKDIFNAQIHSKKQLMASTSTSELQEIIFNKGGYSLLFYRSGFKDQVSSSERQLQYHLGAIGQFENDLFDIFKDYHEGIHTLATRSDNIASLRKIFNEKINLIVSLVHQTAYPQKNKIKFIRFISLFLCRGYVCLDMLEALQKNKPFNVADFQRKKLICDMEKPMNFLKSVHYFCKMNPIKPSHI